MDRVYTLVEFVNGYLPDNEPEEYATKDQAKNALMDRVKGCLLTS